MIPVSLPLRSDENCLKSDTVGTAVLLELDVRGIHKARQTDPEKCQRQAREWRSQAVSSEFTVCFGCQDKIIKEQLGHDRKVRCRHAPVSRPLYRLVPREMLGSLLAASQVPLTLLYSAIFQELAVSFTAEAC